MDNNHKKLLIDINRKKISSKNLNISMFTKKYSYNIYILYIYLLYIYNI